VYEENSVSYQEREYLMYPNLLLEFENAFRMWISEQNPAMLWIGIPCIPVVILVILALITEVRKNRPSRKSKGAS
jgi:hypothetical protein